MVRAGSLAGRSGAFAALLLACAVLAGQPAVAASPSSLLEALQTRSGTAASAERGRAFFTARHGGEWSCSSCHGQQPTATGRHALTGRGIGALAPAIDAERFTDEAKVEKWFRRNCKDVLSRECSAAEKADVLAWLIGLGAQPQGSAR